MSLVVTALNHTVWAVEQAYDYVYVNYVDLYYMGWLAWVFYPLVVTFLLPALIIIFLYASALFLQLYRLRGNLRDAYGRDFYDGARHILSVLWIAQGRIWHGHEVIGFDKIPDSGPALLVYYHGAIPIDLYYVLAKIIVDKKRRLWAVGDKFLYKIPGFKLLMEVFNVLPGTVSKGVELMKQGELLAIAPGGVREAYFSDEYYKLMWGGRVGFAKIALQAKVPVIPMFTQNLREGFRSLGLGRSWLQKWYEKTRLPIVPIYGMFPVKMRTFIGNPIEYSDVDTPELLAEKVKASVEELIIQYQVVPGNILRGIAERFYTPPHCKPS